MTKRAAGKFERLASDLYPTPVEAVRPLIPHLRRTGVTTFVEPCCADGQLARHLDEKGFLCVKYDDITEGGRDAREWDRDDFKDADACITNPPWEAKLMAEIMEHQSGFVPSWFLVYSDWLFTHQSAKLMSARCTDIVPIGRVKWFPESKSVGFDNCCWIRLQPNNLQPVTSFWPMVKQNA